MLAGLASFSPAQATIPTAPAPPSPPSITSTVYDAATFGAAPDDGLSDSAALQGAMDAASAGGGGTVQLGAGRYDITIDPATGLGLQLRGRVRIAGAGEQATSLRLADGQGDYKAIFGQTLPAQPADDIAIERLTIDGNTAGNPLVPSSLPSGPRISVLLYAGHRSEFRDITFTDQKNFNVLAASGAQVTDVAVISCVFADVGGAAISAASPDYDHSSVYLFATRGLVSGNTFKTRAGPGSSGTHAAIETHGDDLSVVGNTIEGYMRGLNVTGVAAHSQRQLISDNVIHNVAMRMYLWSRTTYTPLPAAALTDVEIRDNQITIDVDPWLATGKTLIQGIATHLDNDSRIDRLKITGNQIEFTDFGTASDVPVWHYDSFAAGISLASRSGAADLRDANIAYNRISNSLSAGIWSEVRFVGASSAITNNTIVNPGRRLHPSSVYAAGLPAYRDSFRSGVYIGEPGQTSGVVQVNDNAVTSLLTPDLLHAGVTTETTCTSACSARHNTVTGSNAPPHDLAPSWVVLP